MLSNCIVCRIVQKCPKADLKTVKMVPLRLNQTRVIDLDELLGFRKVSQNSAMTVSEMVTKISQVKPKE